MTPLYQFLRNRGIPASLAVAVMIVLYAAAIFSLGLTLGYEYNSPVLYLDAR